METLERVKGKRCEQNVWSNVSFPLSSQKVHSFPTFSILEATFHDWTNLFLGRERVKEGRKTKETGILENGCFRKHTSLDWEISLGGREKERVNLENKLCESERNGFDRMTILLARIWSATQTFESKCSKWPRIVMTGTKLENQNTFNRTREHFCESFPLSKKHKIRTRHVLMRRVPVQSLNFRLYSDTDFQTLSQSQVIKCKSKSRSKVGK